MTSLYISWRQSAPGIAYFKLYQPYVTKSLQKDKKVVTFFSLSDSPMISQTIIFSPHPVKN